MTSSADILFKLLRIALGNEGDMSLPDVVDWRGVIELSYAQGVPALAVDGVQRLTAFYEERDGVLPPQLDVLEQPEMEEVAYQWFGEVMACEEENAAFADKCRRALAFFRKAGFCCCILKGSGLGQLYDAPDHRATGDIDVWLDGGREKVFAFARSLDPEGRLYGVNYHHIHFHLFSDPLVEGHIYPSWFASPVLNSRWKRFCAMHRPDNSSDVPSLAFNRVFVLLHIFHHYGGHGITLKQLLDYYHVLLQGFTPEERDEAVAWLRRLHLDRFAAAMMWVQHFCLGLPVDCLLVMPEEKEGRRLLADLLQPCSAVEPTPLRRFLANTGRDIRLALRYPHDALWKPAFSLWLYAWRLRKGYL